MTATMKTKAEERLSLSAAIRRIWSGSFRVAVTDEGMSCQGDLIRFYEVTLSTPNGNEVFGADDPKDVVRDVATWLSK